MNSGFRFQLNQRVQIEESGECGLVIGRAEYTYSNNLYFVRYKAGDRRAVEAWWGESALVAS